MSLYNIDCIRDGQVVYSYNPNGSCTGVFQHGPHGRSFYQHCRPDAFIVNIRLSNRLISKKLIEAFIATPLIQNLCPVELIEVRAERAKVKFNSGDLPSDQVICAMRLLNVWFNGLALEWPKKFAEYELTPAELLIMAVATHANGRTSDNMPVLWYITKADIAKIDYSYNAGGLVDKARTAPVASMLLPLIRGEIRQGWQPSLKVGGYAKEWGIFGAMKGRDDWAYGVDYHEACADDNFLTVNNPLIHVDNLAGPEIQLHGRNYTEVTEWVLTQLGK